MKCILPWTVNDLSLTMLVNVILLANFQLSRLGDLPVFLDSFLLWQRFLSLKGQVSHGILNLENLCVMPDTSQR